MGSRFARGTRVVRMVAFTGTGLVLALAGCSTAAPVGAPSAPSAPAAGAGASAPAPASPAPPSPAAPVAPPAPAPPAAAGGSCATIDLAAATALLGGTPKQQGAAPAGPGSDGNGPKMTKIDGCSYTGTDPALGYTVNRLDDGVMAKAFVSAAKAQMGDEGGCPYGLCQAAVGVLAW